MVAAGKHSLIFHKQQPVLFGQSKLILYTSLVKMTTINSNDS